jgi:hypothetical protein
MFVRIRQGLEFLFLKYDKNRYDKLVESILDEKEKSIFDGMEEYDKVHSIKVLIRVLENETLSQEIIFKKLALLHDCGKGKVSLFRRVKKVILGDKLLERHPEFGYEKLKDIDEKLAILCRKHHIKNKENIKMSIFQKLDDM